MEYADGGLPNTSIIEEPNNRAKRQLNISLYEGIKCITCTTSLKMHKISKIETDNRFYGITISYMLQARAMWCCFKL